MKKYLFVLLTISFFKVNAQTSEYVSFPDSNAVWDILVADPSSEDSIWYTVHYGLSGDTIINLLNYHKVYYNNGLSDSVMVFSGQNTIYNGAIREDTSAKKVFYVPKDSIHEGLIYQFNLSYHDTVMIPTVFGYEVEYVCINYSYDSIQLLNNQYRRRYILQSTGNQMVTWIEGIGSDGGLLYNYYWPFWDSLKYTLRCFHQNDTLLFHMNGCPWPIQPCLPIFDDCYTLGLYTKIDQNKETLENDIDVFPNPVSDRITLNISNFKILPLVFQLFDMQGSLQSESKITNSQTELNVSSMPRGVYVLKMMTDKELITKKIILY